MTKTAKTSKRAPSKGAARASAKSVGKVASVEPLSAQERASAARRRAPARAQVTPGLTVVTIELADVAKGTSGEKSHPYRVRTASGAPLPASLAPGFDEAFARECLRDYRAVLAEVRDDGTASLVGALQTRSHVSRDDQDTAELSGKRVEIRADEEARIVVGKAALKLGKDGQVRLVGNRATIDMAALVKVMSALVELP